MAIGALALVGSPPSAQADKISDWLRVYDPTGAIVHEVSVLESLEDPNAIYYINVPDLVDPGMYAKHTLVYEYGGNEVDGPWSDIFGITYIPPGLFLAFMSDQDGVVPAFGPPSTYFVGEEPWGIIADATRYLRPDLRADGWTAQFFSDGDQVPDMGATGSLLGLALAGLALARRRFR